MQSTKRQIRALTVEIQDLYKAIESVPPLNKLPSPSHEEIQEARLLQMRDALHFVLRAKREYWDVIGSGCSAPKLRARMRASFETAIGALMDHNTDLRRGEKCVSLRRSDQSRPRKRAGAGGASRVTDGEGSRSGWRERHAHDHSAQGRQQKR
jgi:hypothetical protein